MNKSFEELLDHYPRERLTRAPTPLDHLPNLSGRLGPEIYLKRDDLTDLTLGGDKPRKLEYELARAREQGADVLITCGSAQSNHARLTAAAARRLGMECEVVLSRDEYLRFQGNLLAVHLIARRVHFAEVEDHWALEAHAQNLADSLAARGEKPYIVPVSGTTPHSCLGYVRAGLEMANQLQEMSLNLDAIYLPFGTGGIFAGILTALRERAVETPLIGISVNQQEALCHPSLDTWWEALSQLLQRDPDRPRGAYEIHDDWVGREYGDPTEACLDAIMLMAGSEGILLDPVYSGKLFSGLVAHCRAGRWRPGQSLLMLHSGGVPALFAYAPELRRHLIGRGFLPSKE
jgi:D-cysteine desulfhydrase